MSLFHILAKNITELRKEIDLLMPNNIANYEQEYERYLKLKKMDDFSLLFASDDWKYFEGRAAVVVIVIRFFKDIIFC